MLVVTNLARNVYGLDSRKGQYIYPSQQRDSLEVWNFSLMSCRGPAKGYTEALEARLLETEDVLFRILSGISVDDLSRALQPPSIDQGVAYQPYPAPLLSDRKQAVEYWTKSSLKTVSDIQRWYEERSGAAEAAHVALQIPAVHGGVEAQGRQRRDARKFTVPIVREVLEEPSMGSVTRDFGSGTPDGGQMIPDNGDGIMLDDSIRQMSGIADDSERQVVMQDQQVVSPDSGRGQVHQLSKSGSGSLGLTSEFLENFLW